MRRVEYAPKSCAQCGASFIPRDVIKSRTQQFCSRACYGQSKVLPVAEQSCQRCAAGYIPKDAYEARQRRFCSTSCARKAEWEAGREGPMTGRTHTAETKARIAAAMTGRPVTDAMRESARSRHGDKAPNWKGGRIINTHGYAMVKPDPGGPYMLEHRLVMEQIIGRPLREEETVHHVNGDRADNRPENLELWAGRQPRGQRVADKVEWAKALLALYEPEALR